MKTSSCHEYHSFVCEANKHAANWETCQNNCEVDCTVNSTSWWCYGSSWKKKSLLSINQHFKLYILKFQLTQKHLKILGYLVSQNFEMRNSKFQLCLAIFKNVFIYIFPVAELRFRMIPMSFLGDSSTPQTDGRDQRWCSRSRDTVFLWHIAEPPWFYSCKASILLLIIPLFC